MIRVGARTLAIDEASARKAYDAQITRLPRGNGRFDRDAVETIRRSLKETGALEQVPPAERLYDERFAKVK